MITRFNSFHLFVYLLAPLHGFAFWFDVEFNMPGFSAINNINWASDALNNNSVNGGCRTKRANPKENIVLSTAPEDPPTHWQQVFFLPALHFVFIMNFKTWYFFWKTVIYFYDPIDVEQDQVIDGSVTLTQSRENQRFMNIQLAYT